MNSLMRQQESEILKQIPLEDKINYLHSKQMQLRGETDGRAGRGRVHDEKMHIASLKKQILEDKQREDIFRKELKSLYQREKVERAKMKGRRSHAKKMEFKRKRNEVIRAICEQKNEDLRDDRLKKLQAEDCKLALFKLE